MPHWRPHPRAIGSARVVPSPAELPPPWRFIWPWVFWLVWGLALAITDMHTSSFQPALLLLFAGSAVLGLARPRAWWLWALALAAWVPAEPLVNAVLRLGLAPQSGAGAWLLPPVPALLGGLVGRLVARAARARGRARS